MPNCGPEQRLGYVVWTGTRGCGAASAALCRRAMAGARQASARCTTDGVGRGPGSGARLSGGVVIGVLAEGRGAREGAVAHDPGGGTEDPRDGRPCGIHPVT